MPANRRRRRGRQGGSVGLYLVAVFGLGCLAWAAVGLLRGTPSGRPARQTARSPALPAPEPLVHPVSTLADEQRPYYPLEVGRYWVYRNEDPISGSAIRQERRIERLERHDGQELYFYDDGGMAYWQDGKVFEIGAQGSLNVIPLALPPTAGPYAYHTQDMYVEKQIGAVDTTVVVQGRRYEGCLEVVTRLQLADRGPESARTYSSYYARGIGLIGQEWWPRERITVTLQEYGVQ